MRKSTRNLLSNINAKQLSIMNRRKPDIQPTKRRSTEDHTRRIKRNPRTVTSRASCQLFLGLCLCFHFLFRSICLMTRLCKSFETVFKKLKQFVWPRLLFFESFNVLLFDSYDEDLQTDYPYFVVSGLRFPVVFELSGVHSSSDIFSIPTGTARQGGEIRTFVFLQHHSVGGQSS